MKFLKLLAVPAVLFASAVMAVPAFAHTVNTASFTIGCGSDTPNGPASQICVTMNGSLSNFAERFIFIDVFPKGAALTPANSLGEKAFDITQGTKLPVKICLPVITNSSATSFTVAIMKITSDKAGKMPADVDFQDVTVNGTAFTGSPIVFTADQQTPVALTDSATRCEVAQTPTPTPTPTQTGGSGAGSPSPTANTATTLAQTGGFDFRFPLIGLVLLVAGGALFVVSASRRSAQTK